DADPDREPVHRVDLRERAGGGDRREAEPDQRHAEHREPARAEAVGQRATDAAKAEIEKRRKREHDRHRAARGAEIALQRLDEGAERIAAAEADERHREAGGDDEPAMEQARRFPGCIDLAVHGGLLPTAPRSGLRPLLTSPDATAATEVAWTRAC